MQRRVDKKHILLVVTMLNLTNGLAAVALRFAGLLPRNGDPALLVILVASDTFGNAVAVVQGVIGASVVADILDRATTGRQASSAMFNAALSFSSKAVSGLGIAKGLIFDLIDLPRHAQPGEVPPGKIGLMGLIVGLCVPMFYLIPIYLIGRYRITRQVHADIRQQLDARAETVRSAKLKAHFACSRGQPTGLGDVERRAANGPDHGFRGGGDEPGILQGQGVPVILGDNQDATPGQDREPGLGFGAAFLPGRL